MNDSIPDMSIAAIIIPAMGEAAIAFVLVSLLFLLLSPIPPYGFITSNVTYVELNRFCLCCMNAINMILHGYAKVIPPQDSL